MNHFYLSLGSNIAPEQNMPRAVNLLAAAGRLLAVSRAFETEPVGETAQPSFLNAAVILASALAADDFKRYVISGIEQKLGRVRDPQDRNAARTIDIDLTLWKDMTDHTGKIRAADSDLLRFAHVAVPLADVAPDLVHPATGETLAVIAARLATSGPKVVPCPEIVLPLPEGGE